MKPSISRLRAVAIICAFLIIPSSMCDSEEGECQSNSDGGSCNEEAKKSSCLTGHCDGQKNLCQKRKFESDSFVCVCNSLHCDDVPIEATTPVKAGFYKIVTSSRDSDRFHVEEGKLSTETEGELLLEIDYSTSFQSIIGFGAAFSDSAGIVTKTLSEKTQQRLLSAYFGEEGLEYNMGRIPIGGTDFSTRTYSYDDVDGDIQLEHFMLAEDDYKFKIPMIKSANQMSRRGLKLFASIWTPPAWMKDSKKFFGKGEMLIEMIQPFTNYILKFIRAYEDNGIHLWGLTTLNQPNSGFIEDWPFNCCGFSAELTRDWLKNYLGPMLDRENLRPKLKIIIGEDTRKSFPDYPLVSLEDPEAEKYIDGISVHWYDDLSRSGIKGPEVLSEIHEKFPNKFLIYTEACEGFDANKDERVLLGSWERAQNYANNIIEDLNHHVTGWVDWNFALNMEGGPNWSLNYVDAPIIVNEKEDEFYKQPMFYALGHFSKFLPEGSTRLKLTVKDRMQEDIFAVAFINPDQTYTVIALNKATVDVPVNLNTPRGERINILLKPKSIVTLMFE